MKLIYIKEEVEGSQEYVDHVLKEEEENGGRQTKSYYSKRIKRPDHGIFL